MPVCLTGDVHHDSLETDDQADLDRPELQTAIEYAEIVDQYNVETTLFVTGRAADERPNVIRRLGQFDGVEIGGHNYAAFTIPRVSGSSRLFGAYRALRGTNCPKVVQRHGIRKAVTRLEAVTGEPVTSWRDHGFNRDRHTNELLAATDIIAISDAREPDRIEPYTLNTQKSLWEVPINTPPDHDHVVHGTHSPPDGWSDPFSGDHYSVETWLNRVTDRIEQIDTQGGVATVLAHPACMALADEFDTFEALCESLTEYETLTLSAAVR